MDFYQYLNFSKWGNLSKRSLFPLFKPDFKRNSTLELKREIPKLEINCMKAEKTILFRFSVGGI